MLSAFAARKLRAGQNKLEEQGTPASTVPSTPLSSSCPPSGRNTPSAELPNSVQKPVSASAQKRKPSSQGPTKRDKKKKKKGDEGKEKDTKGRYFAQGEVFMAQAQDEVIVIEGSEDEEDRRGSSPSSGMEDGEGDISMTLTTPRISRGRRVWSPSRLIQDSSDEEDEEDQGMVENGGANLTDLIDVARRPAQESFVELSTFRPLPGQNTFPLSSEEIGGLPSTHESSASAVTVLLMSPGDALCLLGVYAFTILRGSLSLCGVTLTPSITAHRVFAPRSSPLPILRCLRAGIVDDGTVGDLPIPNRILKEVEGRDGVALVLLRSLETGVEGLGRVCRTFDGVFEPSRSMNEQPLDNLGVPGVVMLERQTRDTHPFLLPSTWDLEISSLLSRLMADDGAKVMNPVVCLVKGPKNSGKSGFARLLLNQLLSKYKRVAYLECDIGQSEFTPGGMVSLNVISEHVFGPPFTHPTLPHSAHYIGATTPRSSPSHYLNSIQALFQTYRLDVQYSDCDDLGFREDDARIGEIVPLVVNTMGWTKGLGAEIMKKIEDIVEASDIFELESPIQENAWDGHGQLWKRGPGRPNSVDSAYGPRYHTIEPIAPSVLSTNYTPADHRTISLLSYFHAIFPPPSLSSGSAFDQMTATTWQTNLPLCAQRPFEVDWSVAIDKVVLVGAGSEDVVREEVAGVLNCALVGLVTCQPGFVDDDIPVMSTESASQTLLPYIQGSPPPSPESSSCLGLGLVRAISQTSSHMHLLTPLPPSLISNSPCRIMVRGEMELPVWGMLDFRSEDGLTVAGVERNKVPFLRWGKEVGVVGGEKRRVRRNLMRRGQM
ncbi:hypothetical protein JAAARDRAFT_202382 [Jaapia argillacea MUCL 33604]|uniref:Polynucleotide 5'-hydroxyl-kinase GRC3 n=1 Tax=Jaapia argillacea MUCL 33604 TaxID=933084 RepID=A0A067QG39_9AGAM|nr:hypothetical protein JAAARDRAFT_202382 [Jaapia argillacea MUCL 33604]